MKFHKLLAAIILSFSLYSCNCEDVNLGKLEQNGELMSFLPAQGKRYFVQYDEARLPLSYQAADGVYPVVAAVTKTGKSQTTGKGGTSDCVEYFTAEGREYPGYIDGQCPFSINQMYTKDVNPYGFNNISDKNQVADVIEYIVGFNNKFPNVISRGMSNYENYMPYRVFTLAKDPEKLRHKRNDITQEFLATVTLNGVQYQNVYHLYLNSPQYTEDEKFFNQHYPLDYPQGIFVKEGVGIIQAYSADGKQIDITVE